MYKEHPVFVSPKEDDIKLWRYMDFTKFVSLLDKQALFFTRADKFTDRFEGSYSEFNVKMRPTVYKDMPEKLLKDFSFFTAKIREYTVVNCWHMSEYESAAMWELFLHTNEGIAIQTDYNRLIKSFDVTTKDIHIGVVDYVDYGKSWIPEGNTMYPFLHKRKSFEHEKELRAIIQEIPSNGETVDFNQELCKTGLLIDIDINELIDNIYVAPLAQLWFFELVSSVVQKYGFKFNVLQSSLGKDPVY